MALPRPAQPSLRRRAVNLASRDVPLQLRQLPFHGCHESLSDRLVLGDPRLTAHRQVPLVALQPTENPDLRGSIGHVLETAPAHLLDPASTTLAGERYNVVIASIPQDLDVLRAR